MQTVLSTKKAFLNGKPIVIETLLGTESKQDITYRVTSNTGVKNYSFNKFWDLNINLKN